MTPIRRLILLAALAASAGSATFAADAAGRSHARFVGTAAVWKLLNGPGWQFFGVGEDRDAARDRLRRLPAGGVDAGDDSTRVPNPRRVQHADERDGIAGRLAVDPAARGKEFYLVFEGAASIADVYVNGQKLGQHRGAYTRFVFDATKALHPGADNELAVLVDDDQADITDCLPQKTAGLYKVWGGLYRNVSLVTTAPVHIDPTNDAAPGVYLTPREVSAQSANLNVRVLLRNTSATDAQAEVRAKILDPDGKEIRTLTAPARLQADARATVEMNATIDHPQLWEALKGRVYHVQTSVYVGGQMVDEVTQPTGLPLAELELGGRHGRR